MAEFALVDALAWTSVEGHTNTGGFVRLRSRKTRAVHRDVEMCTVQSTSLNSTVQYEVQYCTVPSYCTRTVPQENQGGKLLHTATSLLRASLSVLCLPDQKMSARHLMLYTTYSIHTVRVQYNDLQGYRCVRYLVK